MKKGHMKNNIHPKYYESAKVKCSCGAEFEVGSTSPEIKVEICSNCHPVYTGNKKLVDTAGRVDRFREKLLKSQKIQDELSKRKSKKTEGNKNESTDSSGAETEPKAS